MGQLNYLLGIEVPYCDGELFLSQRKYMTDLLEFEGVQDCKPANNRIDAKHNIWSSPDSEIVNKGQYQWLVGKLIHLSHTRLDISCVVRILSQFMHDPRVPHQQAAQRVLAYLKGIVGKGLQYKHNKSLSMQIYTDAFHLEDKVLIEDEGNDMTPLHVYKRQQRKQGAKMVIWTTLP